MVVVEEVGLRDSWLLTKKGTSILGLFSLTIKNPSSINILKVQLNSNMSTTEERLKLLKEDLQRARAEREAQRTLRTAEIAAAKQSRDEAALERREDIMSQLRTMRELLGEQQESQALCRDQIKQDHEEEMRWREDTLGQMSDVQAALVSLRDERRVARDQRAEEHTRANAGEYLPFRK